MNKALKNILIILSIIILTIIITLIALGVMPGISQSKDLGVKYTQQDLDNYYQKANYQVKELPAGSKPSIRFTGSQQVNVAWTDEELTARMNNDKWINHPAKNVQIKINADGTVQASAMISKTKAVAAAQSFGFPGSEIKMAQDFIKYLPEEIPVYIQGDIQIKDNRIVSYKLDEAKVGNLSLLNFVKVGQIVDYAQSHLRTNPAFNIKSLDFDNGQMKFEGSHPTLKENVVGY